jgi:hypothetical protein
MIEDKVVAVNVNHSKEGYVIITNEHWDRILELLIEDGVTVKFLYDDDCPGDTGC